MAYLVKTMPRAECDLETIFKFIQAETSEPAWRWFNGLTDAIESLSDHPQRNPVIPEDTTLRHLLYGHKPHIYRIIYFIDASRQMVNVIHVRHRARDGYNPD